MQEVRGWSDLTQMERCYINQDMFSFVPGAYDRYQALIQEDRRRSQQVKSEKFSMADDVLICEQVDYIEIVYQIECKEEDVSDEVIFRNVIISKENDQVIRNCEICQGEKQKQSCVFCEYHHDMDRHVVDLKNSLYSFEYCDRDCVPRLMRHAVRYKSVVAMDVERVCSSRQGKNVEEPIHVTLISYDGQVIYSTYVMPRYKVIDYREKITGIIDFSKYDFRLYDDVKLDIDRIIGDSIVVGHAIFDDLDLFGLKKTYFDTLSLVDGQRVSLQVMMAYVFGVAIQNGVHSSIDDAMSAMLLYRALVGKRIDQSEIVKYKSQRHVLRVFSSLLFEMMLQGVIVVGKMCCSACLFRDHRMFKGVEEFDDREDEKVYEHMSKCQCVLGRNVNSRKRKKKREKIPDTVTHCYKVQGKCIGRLKRLQVEVVLFLDCGVYSLVVLSDVRERISRGEIDLRLLYPMDCASIEDLRIYWSRVDEVVTIVQGRVVNGQDRRVDCDLRGPIKRHWVSMQLFANRYGMGLKLTKQKVKISDSIIKVMLFEVWLHTFFDCYCISR